MLPRKWIRPALLSFVLTTAISCQMGTLPPIVPGTLPYQPEDNEKKLWQIGEQIDRRIEKRGFIYSAPELEGYLNAVAVKLYAGRLPGQEFAPRIKVVKDPFLNAFALPHGSIYLHTGMLARIENEAQLATILSHELIHFIHRHSAEKLRGARNTQILTGILQVFLLGVVGEQLAGQLGDVFARASISGYSKNLEREADEEGLRAVAQSGYDPKESVAVFELLKQESQESNIKEPYFFGTHPRLEERIENSRRLLRAEFQQVASDGGSRTNAEEYLAQIHVLLLDNATLDIELGRFKIAHKALDKHFSREPKSFRGHFLMGEIHRRSGRNDDAIKSYALAVDLNPNHADSHRELGLLYRSGGRAEDARKELEQYLSLNSSALDAPIIRGYINDLPKP